MKLRVYAAGSMEHAVNLGAGWRDNLTSYMKGLNIEVLNPCLFEEQQLKGLHPGRLPAEITNRFTGEKFTPKHWHELKMAQEPKFFQRFLRYMHRIIRYDINLLIDDADFVVCLWDLNASKGAGTHAELTTAFLHNKPVYCVETTPMPAWALGCCTKVFKNFEELYEFLDEEFGE
jgi:nucleoside 2-deoxyribosyltransferase